MRELCLKQGQGLNARAAPPYPSICWVPPPPGTVMRLQCPKFSPKTVVKRHKGLFLADIATVPFHVAHIFDDPEDVLGMG